MNREKVETAVYHALFNTIDEGRRKIANELGIHESNVEITGEFPNQKIKIIEGIENIEISFTIKGEE